MNIARVFIPEPSFGDRFAMLGFDIMDNLSFYFIVPLKKEPSYLVVEYGIINTIDRIRFTERLDE